MPESFQKDSDAMTRSSLSPRSTTSTSADVDSDNTSPVAFDPMGSVHQLEVSESAGELAKNLPELIEQLKQLQVKMEQSSKVFESVMTKAAHQAQSSANDDVMPTLDEQLEFNERQSSSMRSSGGNYSSGNYSSGNYDADERRSFVRTSISKRSQHMNSGPRSSLSMMSAGNADYSIMWVSGECGISLRNFAQNKIGAQIAVLQQAQGVTTGIANCRLGDQLMAINGEPVEDLRFKEIVQKLKVTRRPITLAFRTNINVQTSPTAAARPGLRQSSSNRASMMQASQRNSVREFFPPDMDDDYRNSHDHDRDSGVDSNDRNSLRSTIMTEELENWRRQQETMHSDIILLLTETVFRCEHLQQENLDQLQSLMQLTPQVLPPSPPRSSSMSSYAPNEAVALRASGRASSSSKLGSSTASLQATAEPA